MGSAVAAQQLPTRPVPYPSFDGTQRCADLDPELFFPKTSRDSYYHPQQTRPACAECPFLQQCRDYAISYGVTGFWGGMSQVERQRERVRIGIAPIPVRVSEHEMVWGRVDELEDGSRSAEEIAAAVGCSAKTVERHRQRRRAEGEAA